MLHFLHRLILISIIALTISSCRSKREVWTPGASPEHAQHEANEKRRKEVKQSDKPLTKGQIRRNMRRRDKLQRKDVSDHHERIQRKEVRKRMRKNNRRAQANNQRQRPNIFRQIIMNFSQ